MRDRKRAVGWAKCCGKKAFCLSLFATHWATRFEAALPCPTPSFVDEKTLAVLVEWLFALQEHRVACLQAMALLLPPELPATS
jgi:hypothetical protein